MNPGARQCRSIPSKRLQGLRKCRVVNGQSSITPNGGEVSAASASSTGWLNHAAKAASQMRPLVRATGQDRARIVADIDRDHILRGEDAVAYGLVDAVLEERALRALPDPGAIAR